MTQTTLLQGNFMDIRYYGDPVLRQVADPIETIDQDVRELADDMVRMLTLKKGYGLAAPQVGVLRRLIVLDVEEFFEIIVNPKILSMSEEKVLGTEGCLSIPGAEAEVLRHKTLRLRGESLEGKMFELDAEDLLARVIQHEIDHLNGILFIDYVGEAKRLQLLKDFERKRKELRTKV